MWSHSGNILPTMLDASKCLWYYANQYAGIIDSSLAIGVEFGRWKAEITNGLNKKTVIFTLLLGCWAPNCRHFQFWRALVMPSHHTWKTWPWILVMEA